MWSVITNILLGVACLFILAVLVYVFRDDRAKSLDTETLTESWREPEPEPELDLDLYEPDYDPVRERWAQIAAEATSPIGDRLAAHWPSISMATGTGMERYRELNEYPAGHRSWQREQAARGLARWQETGEYDEPVNPFAVRPYVPVEVTAADERYDVDAIGLERPLRLVWSTPAKPVDLTKLPSISLVKTAPEPEREETLEEWSNRLHAEITEWGARELQRIHSWSGRTRHAKVPA